MNGERIADSGLAPNCRNSHQDLLPLKSRFNLPTGRCFVIFIGLQESSKQRWRFSCDSIQSAHAEFLQWFFSFENYVRTNAASDDRRKIIFLFSGWSRGETRRAGGQSMFRTV
jgi:hypothetical protein